ncbi:hypothetical protein WN943_007539 [Citrus x changshan-huyou]
MRVEIWDPLPSAMKSQMFVVECKRMIKFDSDSERCRILIDLMTYNFNCLKDKVRLKAEKYRWRVDDEAHSIYEAIEKKHVRQLHSASKIGHGRRH